MNISSILHAALALLFQVVIGLLTNNWWAGAAFGSAFYFGREVAQHESHRLEYFGHRASFGSDEGMPWYEGFKVSQWTTDSKLDLLLPVTAVSTVAIFTSTEKLLWLKSLLSVLG